MRRTFSVLLAAALSLSFVFAAEEQTARADLGACSVVMEGVTKYNYLAGEKVRCGTITCNNTVYIPLMTVGLWLGADTTWNAASQTVTLTPNGSNPIYYSFSDIEQMGVTSLGGNEQYSKDMDNGIEVQLLPNATVTLDGQRWELVDVWGQRVSPLLFRDCLFLPVDSVAQKAGKTLLRYGGDIYLYDMPTQAQAEEANAYLATVREHLNAVRSIATGDRPQSLEEFHDKVKDMQGHLVSVLNLAIPSFQPLQKAYAPNIQFWASYTLYQNIDPYLPAAESSGAKAPYQQLGRPTSQISRVPKQVNEWDRFAQFIVTAEPMHTTNYMDLEKHCLTCELFMAAVASGKTEITTPPPSFIIDRTEEPEVKAPKGIDPTTLTDAKDIQYWDAVASLTKLGVVSGKDDGGFDPAGNVTRAEAAKMIAVLMNGGSEPNMEAKEAPTFSDIQGHWAEPYIEYCADMHIVNGWDGRFDPDGNVTVVELYKMALTALGHDAETYHLMGASWAAQTIERATKVNSRSGVKLSDGLVNVEEMDVYQPASREVTAQILCNALLANPIVATPDSQTPDGTVVWKYSPVENETLLHQRFDMDELPAVPPQPTV